MDPIISNMWIHSPDRSGRVHRWRCSDGLIWSLARKGKERGGVQPERMRMKCSAECVCNAFNCKKGPLNQCIHSLRPALCPWNWPRIAS